MILNRKIETTDFTEDTDFEEFEMKYSLTQKVSGISINSFCVIS